MMDLYPWEEAEAPEPDPATETPTAAFMKPAEAAGAGTEAAPAGAVAGAGVDAAEADPPEPGEPAELEPELQPDGDPRELDTTEADEVPAERAAPRPEPETQTPRHGDPLRPHARERPVARKEYYSIGEVSDLVGLPPHVLRYWEAQFAVLNPSKNRSGNRAYQRKEIRLILLVKHLLYEEKYTVEGAKAKLDQLRRAGSVQDRAGEVLDAQTLALLREDVTVLRALIAGVA